MHLRGGRSDRRRRNRCYGRGGTIFITKHATKHRCRRLSIAAAPSKHRCRQISIAAAPSEMRPLVERRAAVRRGVVSRRISLVAERGAARVWGGRDGYRALVDDRFRGLAAAVLLCIVFRMLVIGDRGLGDLELGTCGFACRDFRVQDLELRVEGVGFGVSRAGG